MLEEIRSWEPSMICRSIRDLALSLAGCLMSAVALGGTLEVRSPSAKLLETSPGRIVTASVVVSNRGANADDFSEVITLPEGWIKIAPTEVPFRLDAGGQVVRVLAVGLPPNAAAGQFPVRYSVRGRNDPSAGDDIDFSVLVSSVNQLELRIEPRPDPVFAGDGYSIRGEVVNRGNTRLSVRMTHKSSLGFNVTLTPTVFTLEAGESRVFTGQVRTDPKLSRRASHAVTIDVQGSAGRGEVLAANRAAVADIIPLISGERDVYHRLPVQFRLTGLMERGHDAQMQMELSGAGTLDEAGRNHIDFVFRGPDIDHTTIFGQRDEYGLSLHGEHWGIDLGDRVFELSPLTEKRTFGRGIGISYEDDDFKTGAFYMRTRYRTASTEELGGYFRKHLGPQLSFQANYLRKWGGDGFLARALPQNIFSIEGRYQRGKILDLRVEYGLAYTDAGQRDDGYRLEARGTLGEFGYVLEHAHAGPNFHGYYNDTDTTYLSVARPITKTLRATASVNRYAGNLEQNPERSTVVNRENSWEAGLRYDISKQTDASLEWRHTEREDILAPASYNFVEDSVRVGLGHNFGILQMRSFLDFGTLDNSLTGETGPFQRYNLFASYQPTPRQRYSAFATYGPSAFSGSRDRALNCGISADWQFKNNMAVNVSYARNQFDSLTGQEQDQIMARARYRFANQDEISIAGRWMSAPSGMDRDEAAVMVTFTRPLGMPVSRKTSVGSVSGRLAVEGQPIPRAIVRAGEDYAVTDLDGKFTFASIKPGTHELQVVNDSLKPEVVMAASSPIKVNVLGAQTTPITLQATRAAALKVRVQKFAFDRGEKLVSAGGYAAALIEVSREGEKGIVEQTDRTGFAAFERLALGRWKLRVLEENLPPNHIIEDPDREIDLKSGQTTEIMVRVLPVKRKLLIIDHGTIR
jgi:predicted porin